MFVGAVVGWFVGVSVGTFVGASVGEFVGAVVGAMVGFFVGGDVGSSVGSNVGPSDGWAAVGLGRLENKPGELEMIFQVWTIRVLAYIKLKRKTK
jgi:hypothetical protein